MYGSTFWDERYAQEDYVYGEKPNDFLVSQVARIKPNSHILCLAEGEGRNAVYLAQLGHNVTAVDISVVALDKGRKLADKAGVKVSWQHADLADYILAHDKWDLIVAIFMHLPEIIRDRVFAQIKTALRPGGLFIGEFYRPDQLRFKTGGPQDIKMLYSLCTLNEQLAGLAISHLEACERHVNEGTGHTGLAAVSQVVAVKS
ncbi:class I SAM-dependent methyltransferase [Alkalimonas mucilaginosa]|uniref:Class I SAM-dependent methyltransferase n=1 Tax=Alkalimonas mucilaginosa TaxID=3057676 RepID=A0ABU7JF15_9GAMM|nr:class I SAM-dependent methyltransferase [Alkalimonas sp. MEB004]MEE2024217.1 class I SAM-dependent methyltransferase [Alkalimonas sp. MEB004]